MNKVAFIAAGLMLSTSVFAAEPVESNWVQILTTVTRSDLGFIQFRTDEPINGSNCANDVRVDQDGIARGLAAVWYARPCKDCDNVPLKIHSRLTHNKILIDLLNNARDNGSIVQILTKGCVYGRANIVDVVAHGNGG